MNLKKMITIALAAAAASSCIATAYAGTIYARLSVSYHLVSIVEDTASAGTACDIFDNSANGNDTMWTETKLTVTTKNNGTRSQFVKNTKSIAMEGRNPATIKVRGILTAKGEHRGGSNNGTASNVTYWNR